MDGYAHFYLFAHTDAHTPYNMAHTPPRLTLLRAVIGVSGLFIHLGFGLSIKLGFFPIFSFVLPRHNEESPPLAYRVSCHTDKQNILFASAVPFP